MEAGWSLDTAIRRVVPPLVYEPYRVVEEAANALEPGAFEEAARLWPSVESSFRVVCAMGGLITRGTFGGVDGYPEELPVSAWAQVWKVRPFFDKLEFDGRTFFNVRLFPVLESPDAARSLVGKSLLDVVARFVLADPEVEARLEIQSVLRDLVMQAGGGGCLVPLSESASEINPLLRALPAFQGQSGEAPSLARALPVVASRLAALGRHLLGGGVSIKAFPSGNASNVETALSAVDLCKPGLRLCLASGDLWQEKEGKIERLYHSVRLEKREVGVAGELEGGSDKNKGGRPPKEEWKSAFNAVMAAALKNSGLFDSAADLQKKMVGYATQNGLDIGRSEPERLAKDWLNRHHPDIRGAVKTRGEE